MSFLRWAGSKKQIIPELLDYWSSGYNRYIEPFAGSASLFFAIGPESAILGDLNAELIETFAVVKSRPRALWKLLQSFRGGKKAYYSIRAQNPQGLAATQRVARFIYLNRFCFNGLYRTNLKGEFNVPYSPSKTGDLPTLDELLEFSGKLKSAEFVAGDFAVTLSNVRKDDFVYLDPPYVVAGRRVFSEYGADCFSEADLGRLKDELIRINGLGAKFVVSYAQCSEAKEYFKNWPVKTVRIRRNIAGFAGARKRAYELLISNIISSNFR